MEDHKKSLLKLLEPFKAEQINSLPKPYKRDSKKGNCKDCGGYHGLPAAHLDYVGHAALTARLLEVDPLWNWSPMSKDANGLPLIVDGGLWINLTICGMTRLGYGDAQGKMGGNAVKECIGDALRNAGMRFGMALDLWHKGDAALFQDDEDVSVPLPETTGRKVSDSTASTMENETKATTKNFKFLKVMANAKEMVGEKVYYNILGEHMYDHSNEIVDRDDQKEIYALLADKAGGK